MSSRENLLGLSAIGPEDFREVTFLDLSDTVHDIDDFLKSESAQLNALDVWGASFKDVLGLDIDVKLSNDIFRQDSYCRSPEKKFEAFIYRSPLSDDPGKEQYMRVKYGTSSVAELELNGSQCSGTETANNLTYWGASLAYHLARLAVFPQLNDDKVFNNRTRALCSSLSIALNYPVPQASINRPSNMLPDLNSRQGIMAVLPGETIGLIVKGGSYTLEQRRSIDVPLEEGVASFASVKDTYRHRNASRSEISKEVVLLRGQEFSSARYAGVTISQVISERLSINDRTLQSAVVTDIEAENVSETRVLPGKDVVRSFPVEVQPRYEPIYKVPLYGDLKFFKSLLNEACARLADQH